MIERYSTPEMSAIWSEANKYKTWLQVELAAMHGLEKFGLVKKGAAEKIETQSARIDCQELARRIDELEKTTRHDVIAFLSALEERLSEESRYIHLGMTSS